MALDTPELRHPHMEENQGAGAPHPRVPRHLPCAPHQLSLRRRLHARHADTHQIRLLVHMGTPPDVPHLLPCRSHLPALRQTRRAHRHHPLVGHQPCRLRHPLHATDLGQVVQDRLHDVQFLLRDTQIHALLPARQHRPPLLAERPAPFRRQGLLPHHCPACLLLLCRHLQVALHQA